MMNNSTIEALKAMRFSAMAAEFERQLGDPAAYSMLGFEERFALMVDAEWNRRQKNRLARCIREAHFDAPGAMIEDEDEAIARVIRMVTEGKVTANDGTDIAIQADSVCVHGDGPKALAFVEKIGAALQAAGVELKAF